MSFLDSFTRFLPTLGFWTLGVIILVAAWMVGRVRRITHAAFFMVLAFTGVAGVFVLLGADFLAGSQVLIYVGAVAIMFLFAIMVSDLKELSDKPLAEPALAAPDAAGAAAGGGSGAPGAKAPKKRRPWVWVALSGLVAAGFAGFVLAALYRSGLATGQVPAASGAGTTAPIGRALFSTYMVPFEVASVVLLVALVGAIVIAAREESATTGGVTPAGLPAGERKGDAA